MNKKFNNSSVRNHPDTINDPYDTIRFICSETGVPRISDYLYNKLVTHSDIRLKSWGGLTRPPYFRVCPGPQKTSYFLSKHSFTVPQLLSSSCKVLVLTRFQNSVLLRLIQKTHFSFVIQTQGLSLFLVVILLPTQVQQDPEHPIQMRTSVPFSKFSKICPLSVLVYS